MGCVLDVLYDLLVGRKHFVRAQNTISEVLSTTSGVPRGSLPERLFFCISVNGLPEIFRFSDPCFFADDLKKQAVAESQSNINNDFNAIDFWVRTNILELATGKRRKPKTRGKQRKVHLAGKLLET